MCIATGNTFSFNLFFSNFLANFFIFEMKMNHNILVFPSNQDNFSFHLKEISFLSFIGKMVWVRGGMNNHHQFPFNGEDFTG
jgi:hypothetical protein